MQVLPLEEKMPLVIPYLEKSGIRRSSPPLNGEPAKLKEIVSAAGDRIKVAGDILDYTHFFVADDHLPYDEAAFHKPIRKPPEPAAPLTILRDRVVSVGPLDASTQQHELPHLV